jgi:hypothetical protein
LTYPTLRADVEVPLEKVQSRVMTLAFHRLDDELVGLEISCAKGDLDLDLSGTPLVWESSFRCR